MRCTVHGSESGGGAGRAGGTVAVGGVAGGGVAVGGRGGGAGAKGNRCGAPRANNAQPPAVLTATVTATTAGRTRRRGTPPLAAEMRPGGGAVARASGTGAAAGVHRSRTT